MLYSIGTASVVRGSTTVLGRGTSWTDAQTSAVYFKLAAVGAPWYTISSIIDDTTLSLTCPYGGVSLIGAGYLIISDVTSNVSLPVIRDSTPYPEEFMRKIAVITANKIREVYDL